MLQTSKISGGYIAIKFYPGLEQPFWLVHDEKLDPYNRPLFAYRFNNYAHKQMKNHPVALKSIQTG